MKIFIVCSRLGYGGAENVAVMWANGFAEKGHDVTLLSNLYEDITFSINENVRKCNLITAINPKWKKWFSAISTIRQFAKKDKPDVIICVMRLCSIVAKLAIIGLHIPIIATEHNAYESPKSAPMPFFTHFYKFHLTWLFDAVTVLTEIDKKVVSKRNIVVMPNPLAFKPSKEITSKRNTILAAGRVDMWHLKGFDVLIKAFAKVVSNNESLISCDGWRLVIAGVWEDQRNFAYLKGLAKKYGIGEEVVFKGFVRDFQSLCLESSVFVLSSRYEGFGLVLIEAMSQGCACVACDYKGRQSEIIQDKSQGLTCLPDNEEDLAKTLKIMIEDDGYRESIRGNAVERSKYYSIDNIIDLWEELLEKVVNK